MESFNLPALENLFRENANPENAFFMKKYMKAKFNFLGIKSLERRALTKVFYINYNRPDINNIENIVRQLWKMEEREFQYFAMELVEKGLNKMAQNDVQLFEYLVVNKSWWDTVDFIAANLVGKHFSNFPILIEQMNKKWISSENMWLNRTALLFQLKYKKNLDTKLLKQNILKCRDSQEFFICKAIGWVLREYSKTNPVWVSEFVDSTTLSPLSKREALKWINRIKH